MSTLSCSRTGFDRPCAAATRYAAGVFRRGLRRARGAVAFAACAGFGTGTALRGAREGVLRARVGNGRFACCSIAALAAQDLARAPGKLFDIGSGRKLHMLCSGSEGAPVRHMKVKSLITPPGVPDWYTRRRLVEQGTDEVQGRAWSGAGVAITKVELGVDGAWSDAAVEPRKSTFAWQRWRAKWQATPGEHELACRAADAQGAVQPLEPDWNMGGMGNNALHRIHVTVR